MSNRKIIIYGPMPLEREKHSLYDFDCGNTSINQGIEDAILRSEIIPTHGQCISVITHSVLAHQEHAVIACAVGQLVTHDSFSGRPCPPRIDIELAGVDKEFKGLALSGAVTAHVMQTLFAQANVPVLEMRMLDVISPVARGLWERSGFVALPHSLDGTINMTMQINRERVDWLVQRWQPRLRPDMIISASPTARFQIA